MKMTVTDTAGLMSIVSNASERNMSDYEDTLEKVIDPEGIHILSFHRPLDRLVIGGGTGVVTQPTFGEHNNIEMRTRWMVKVMNTLHPVNIWLDVDPGVLDKHTWNVDYPDDFNDPEH